MKRLTSLLLLWVFSLCGCAVWHHNTISTEGDTRTLTLRTTAAGLLIGPCTPYWGKDAYVDAVFRLHGIKDRYSEGDFDIVGTRYRKEDIKGFISVNKKARTVQIKVYANGEPFGYNGHYSYTTEDN
jgi:hypothetical protein